MARSIETVLAKRPVDRAMLDGHKKRTLDAVRAYRLRELREAHTDRLTQVQSKCSQNAVKNGPPRSVSSGLQYLT